MNYSLEQLINKLLSKSEQMEVDLKKETEIEELTIKQLQCIELIVEMNNPNLSDLAERLNVTKPSTTVMIDKLEKKGYVEKVKSNTDKRSANIHLTKKGEEAGQLHTNLHFNIAKELTKSLTPSEKEILEVILNKSMKMF